jgi:L-rhamnose mutarotase
MDIIFDVLNYRDSKEKITMERIAFKLKLREGKRDEYRRLHDNIWPELLEVLKEAGIQNYTIWNAGDDLFGYYEVHDTGHSNSTLANRPVIARWNEIMSDIYYPDIDPETGTVREMKLMFKYNLID